MNTLTKTSTLRNPRKRDLLICCLLVFSFCYELPLIELTSYDRFNPRLVDVMTIFALFTTKWRRNKNNSLVRAWEYLTIIFVCAAIIAFLFLLPRQYGYYSIFFAGKYVETLLGIWILTGFNWQNHHIEKMMRFFCYGMIMAGTWGVLQYIGVLGSERYLPNGELIVKQSNTILATFGITYFHSGIMGAMGAGIALTLFQRKAINKIIFALAFCASGFLALFSGSRAGLAVFLLIVAVILSKDLKTMLVSGVIIAAIASAGLYNYVSENSITAQRIQDSASHNTVEKRLKADYFGLFGEIVSFHGAKLFAVGGGFYAVPLNDTRGSGIRYRIGYGFHNIHFFPIEQAGIAAFIAAGVFWYRSLKKGFERRKEALPRCGLAIAASIFTVGWAGQIFFHGFGTENMVTFQVFIMVILISMAKKEQKTMRRASKAKPNAIEAP